MDGNSVPQPQVYISPTPFYRNRLFLIFTFIVILVLIPLGFYIFKTYFLKTPEKTLPQQTQVSSKSTIEESESPISFDILQNPLVYEWRGSVEGTLVAKDNESITIAKDGQKITLPIDPGPNGIKFYTKESFKIGPEKDNHFLTIDKIPLGTKLRGEFWVFPSKKEQLFTGSFTVIEE